MDESKKDVEIGIKEDPLLKNNLMNDFTWISVSVSVKERGTKELKAILSGVNGYVKAGRL